MAEFFVPVNLKVFLSSQEGLASYCQSILSRTTTVSAVLFQIVPAPTCTAPSLICAIQGLAPASRNRLNGSSTSHNRVFRVSIPANLRRPAGLGQIKSLNATF